MNRDPLPDSELRARDPQETIAPDPHLRPGEGSLWIRCRAYQAHRFDHRRDRATGLWYCPSCQREPGAPHPGEVTP